MKHTMRACGDLVKFRVNDGSPSTGTIVHVRELPDSGPHFPTRYVYQVRELRHGQLCLVREEDIIDSDPCDEKAGWYRLHSRKEYVGVRYLLSSEVRRWVEKGYMVTPSPLPVH